MFPDPVDDDLSPFHISTLAIGKGHDDHTAVMDRCANEIKDVSTGNDFFVGQRILSNK
jgi:hypothetical protein